MDTPAKDLIRHNIRRLRLNCGYTQKQLADLINKTVPTIANLEQGRSLPTINNLEAIAKALNVSFQDFFTTETDNALNYTERQKIELNIRKILHQLSNEDLEVIYRQIKALVELRKRD